MSAPSPRPGDGQPLADNWVDAAARAHAVGRAALPAAAYRTARVVRFGDCDPAGIVYTPRFVDMMNEAVERFFGEALGLDYYGLIRGGTGLGYGRIGCDFFRPALMGETLELVVLVPRIGGASASLTVHGFRGADEVMRGTLVMVTTEIEKARAIRLPPPLRAALTRYQERCR
jgi:acyl-CoA thioesterase FadM